MLENINFNSESEEESVNVIFGSLEDPRLDRKKLYPLSEIMFLCLSAVLIGVKSWRGVETFGNERLEWLQTFMPFLEGIPSHQTIGRVCSIVKPSAMEKAFIQFMSSATGKKPDQIIALDGKTLRGSFDKAASQKPLHILNACATENGLTIGHLLVDKKTNEITAVPELLDMLDLKNVTITADALNTQKNIAEKIISQGNDYVLPVKGNQKNLQNEVTTKFSSIEFKKEDANFKYSIEKEHGRIDRRFYSVLPLVGLNEVLEWKGVKSIGTATTETEKNGKISSETRYFICSFEPDVERFAKAVRSHWAIENKLHWTLDVTFREDESRVRKDHAPVNFSLIRKLALNLHRAEKSTNKSVPQKMIKASLNPSYHEKLLKSCGF